ncbi:hypothetical protein Y032_1119g3631 [Ancylostoma ceylanicum]|nr:hypothetical protein Y032_1119g3631 [Ancylostoma ceylanicum]
MPIILGAKSLKTFVNHHKENTKNSEYSKIDYESYEKCVSTIALQQSRLRQIEEAKLDLQNLYKELREEYTNCKDESEKKDIMAEIEKIERESQVQTAITEANDLIFLLTARLNESKNTRENMEICLKYPKSRAEKVYAPTKNDSEIIQSMADTTEQIRNHASFSSVSQTSSSSQNRYNSMVHLKKENAANAYIGNRLRQKSNSRVTQSRARHTSHRPNYIRGCIFCHKGNHSSTRCRTVSDQSMRRRALREQNRCWKCFSPNHNSFVCHKQDCTSCGQKHHNSLCFKKEALQVNYGKEQKVITETSNRRNTRNWQNRGQIGNNNQPIRAKSTPVAVQMCAETVSESNTCPPKTTNRQVVLMTAEGSIWNAKKRQYEKVLFLFDSGSQKTVIEEKLAEQFALSKVRSQMCTVSGDGGHTETFKCHTVSLKIGTAFGEDIETVVETRQVITNGSPSDRQNLLLQYTARLKDVELLAGYRFQLQRVNEEDIMRLRLHVPYKLW